MTNPLYAGLSITELLEVVDAAQQRAAHEWVEIARLLEKRTIGGAEEQYAEFYARAEQFLESGEGGKS